MKKLFTLSFLSCLLLNQVGATSIYFPVLDMTGATNDVVINVRAVNNPTIWNSRFYYLPKDGTNLTTVNGYLTNAFAPGVYTMAVVGLSKSWTIYVTNSASELNAVDLSREITRYSGIQTLTATGLQLTNDGYGNFHITATGTNGGSADPNVLTNSDTRAVSFATSVAAPAYTGATANISAISAVTLTASGGISGPGTGLTAVPASAIASGTIDDARLPGTITSDTTGNAATVTSVAGNATQIASMVRSNSVRWFNVENYGAASGVESTLAISNTIVAAQNVGGVVYFPSNNYIISAPLFVTKQVTLKGDTDFDFSTSVARPPTITNNGTGQTIIITNPVASLEAPNGIVIEGIKFAAAATNSASSIAVQARCDGSVTAIDSMLIQRCAFTGFNCAIVLSNVSNSLFVKSSIYYVSTGVKISGPVNNTIGFDCFAISPSGIGFQLDDGQVAIRNSDIGFTTNGINAVNARFSVKNVNMEIGQDAQNGQCDAAIKLISTSTTGLPTVDLCDVRLVSDNSIAVLTNTYSIITSNYIVNIGAGNSLTFVGKYGQPIQDWVTIPGSVYSTYIYRSIIPAITNAASQFCYNPAPWPIDSQASGISPSAGNRGNIYANIRSTGNDELDAIALFEDGSYRKVNLFQYFTDTSIRNRLGIGGNSFTGYSGSSTWTGLDVCSQASILIGSTDATLSRNNNTIKEGVIVGAPYAIANPAWMLLGFDSLSGNNVIYHGGGFSAYHAATTQEFYAAANGTTASGTKMMSLTTAGLFMYSGNLTVTQTNVVNALWATNFIAITTNYFGGNWTPVQGQIRFFGSNNAVYSVSTTKTNLIVAP